MAWNNSYFSNPINSPSGLCVSVDDFWAGYPRNADY